MPMFLGYNTNGFAHHRIEDALTILAEIGYRSVALTLDHPFFDPPDVRGVGRAADTLSPILKSTGLKVTIETGARFLLDARRKHQPTLVSASPDERRVRLEFLKAAVDLAQRLDADCVSLWSGAADDDAPSDVLLSRLVEAMQELLDDAGPRGVRLGFEPEPDMLIETMAAFSELHAALNHPLFGLTLDVGHIICLEDGDIVEHIRRWSRVLFNVHLEDMRRGEHVHRMFGEGEVNPGEVFQALRDIDYAGPVHVELSRHSHDAVETARRAFAILRPQIM